MQAQIQNQQSNINMIQIVSQSNLLISFQSDEENVMRVSVSDNFHLKKFNLNMKKMEDKKIAFYK